MTTYIADTDHYSKVITQIPKVKRLLWIATADLKDLYVEKKGGAVVQILNDLVKKGVETLFSQLDDQFMVCRNYAKQQVGLFARIISKVSALTVLQYVIFINNKPIGRVKYALI